MTSPPRPRRARFSDIPEVNVVAFAFMLNFVWEFLQVPFFRNMARLPHWEAVKFCAVATMGDATIMLVAFWIVAATARTRQWVVNPGWGHLAIFAGVGIAITVVLEFSALSSERWEYSEAMPVVLGIGVAPLLQWLILPLLTAWLVRRQLT